MTPDEEAIAAWHVIESELRRLASDQADRLPRGATCELIQRVEAELGTPLPDSTLAVYLVRNGLGTSAPSGARAQVSELLSLDAAMDRWRELTTLLHQGHFAHLTVELTQGAVRADWWNQRWLPISDDGAGNHFCIDLAPPEGGVPGQVILFRGDDDIRSVVAPTLTAYLLQHIDVEAWARREAQVSQP
jgi:cell wall assembly regulator SMI1